jgi:hypothetical protein
VESDPDDGGKLGGTFYRMSKAESASVGSNYRSRAKCSEIYRYYDGELIRNGWHWRTEYAVRDPEGISNVYRKDQYSAVVSCADGGPYAHWKYEVYLSWSGPTSGVWGLLAFLGLFLALCVVTASVRRWKSRQRTVQA